MSSNAFTPGVCARLKDPADDAVLTIFPVLRVLVLRSVNLAHGTPAARSHAAFVTDGREYAWLALTSSVTERAGDRDDRGSLRVGSLVRLKKMSRLPATDNWYLRSLLPPALP